VIELVLRWARVFRVWVVISTVVLAAGGALALRWLRFDPDVLHLLPRHGVVVPAFAEFLQRFGSLDELLIVFEAPAGERIDAYEDQIADFADRLAHAPEVGRVDTGLLDPSRDWRYVADRLLLVLEPQHRREALSRFQPERLTQQLLKTRELLSLPGPDVASWVRRDPLGLLPLMRDQLSGMSPARADAAGADTVPQGDAVGGGYVTLDGRSRLVVARPVRPPFDTAFSRQLFDRLAAIECATIAGDAGEQGSGRTPTVRYAGGHRIALETEQQVRRETIWNSVGALAAILPLLYLAFRSLWLVAVGAVPSALAILLVLAAYAVGGATLSASAAGAAAMQFGLGIDGVVLLFVAFRHLTAAGESTANAVPKLKSPATSMLLGMWTTAATFYGLALVDFPSLEELGLIIGHGMVLCGILTLVLIPALLPRTPPRSRPLTAWWLTRIVRKQTGPILAGALIVTAASGLAATGLRIDPSLERLRSNTTAAAFELDVSRRFGLPQEVLVVLARDRELEPLLEANARLVEQLRGTLPVLRLHAPTSLLPPASRQMAAAADLQQSNLSPAIVQERILSAARTTGFRPGTFDPFVEQLPRLLDSQARLTYDGFREHGLDDVLSRTLTREGRDWIAATYLYPEKLGDVETIRAVVSRAGRGLTLTGLAEVNRELQARFAPEFSKGLLFGLLLVVSMLLLTFRRIDLTLLALVPTALALVWAAGVLAFSGIELDLFSVFAVMTFVGIGVDYGIHLVHRFREARHSEVDEVIAHLGPVILVAGTITLLGFGTLVFSSYPPLRSLGLVSLVLVVTLVLASVLVLPALLVRRGRM
jgi:uncharacterized protein